MSTNHITSRDNKLFKQWQSLNTSKGIERAELVLVSGRKIVPELLAVLARERTTLLVRAKEECTLAAPRIVYLAKELFDELDEFGTNAPLLVMPAPEIAIFDNNANARRGVTLALATQDPSNLGAILRSALAFEVDQVVLLAECAYPYLPRVTRASAGANFRVALSKGPSIKALDTNWIALDTKGDLLDQARLPPDCAFLMGEEGLGIPEDFRGRRLKIPISANAELLNVAVAAGIVLAAYRRTYPL